MTRAHGEVEQTVTPKKAAGTYDVPLRNVESLIGLDLDTSAEGFVDVGPEKMGWTNLGALNILPQIRTEFDSSNLESLADAMIVDDDGVMAVRLIHPLSVSVHTTPESATRYLEDHASYYQIPEEQRITLEDLSPNDEGHFEILGMGNRRTITLRSIMTSRGIPLDQARVSSSQYMDAPFKLMHSLQSRENTYVAPNPADDARSIQLYYDWHIDEYGTVPSNTKIAGYFGFSRSKVKECLEFARLPEDIKQYAYDGLVGRLLPFSTVLKLGELYGAYTAYNNGDAELSLKDVNTFCETEFASLLKGKKSMRLPNQLLANRIKELRDEAEYQSSPLFDIVDASPTNRSEMARRRYISEIARAVDVLIRTDEIRPDEVAVLQRILSQRALAETVEATDQDVADLLPANLFDITTKFEAAEKTA